MIIRHKIIALYKDCNCKRKEKEKNYDQEAKELKKTYFLNKRKHL